MIKISSGLKNGLLSNSGVREALLGGVITLYPGPRRSHPNQAIAVPALAHITLYGETWEPAPDNTAGLQFAVVAGTTLLAMQDIWTVSGAASGEAAWFSFTGPALDPGQQTTLLPRIDGDCGSDLVLASYSMTPTYSVDLESFTINFAI